MSTNSGKLVRELAKALHKRPSELLKIDLPELVFDGFVLGVISYGENELDAEERSLAPISEAYARIVEKKEIARSLKSRVERAI